MNRVVHFEIPSSDPEKSMEFYGKVFGWTFGQFGTFPYWLATTGNESAPGINGAIMTRRDPGQPVTNSISVIDIDDAIQKVEGSGGKLIVKKIAFPGIGWAAYFSDPDNNIFGLWQEDLNAR
jgi:uncharacterized protein